MTPLPQTFIVVSLLLFGQSRAFAEAALPFTETFEAMDTSYPNGWWDTSCTGGSWPNSSNPGLSTTRAFAGAHSMKYHYGGHQAHHMGTRPSLGLPEWPLSGGCSGGKQFVPTTDLWLTWAEFIEPGFEIDEIGTKSIQVGFLADGQWGYAWYTYMWGSRALTFDPYIRMPSGNFDTVNLGLNYTVPTGRWVCLESHLTVNTPGQANGIMTFFAEGQQRANYTNLEWGNTVLNKPYQDMKFKFIGIYVQDGMGDLYRDNLTVSATRVGCGSGSGGDTTAPAPPRGLTLTL